jgi:hypothetical protein
LLNVHISRSIGELLPTIAASTVVKDLFVEQLHIPQNPNSPPKDVRWGEASTDEMCMALFGYTD